MKIKIFLKTKISASSDKKIANVIFESKIEAKGRRITKSFYPSLIKDLETF